MSSGSWLHRTVPGIVTLIAAVVFGERAGATDRHFNHTYESLVLNPGSAEIEPWSTWRFGRREYYSRFDQRLEFEYGLIQNLQTSLYWNFTAVTADAPNEMGELERESELVFTGISSEWKYKFTDPVADPIGTAGYLEGTIGPAEAEIEAKFIVDKNFGAGLVAANLVGEYEWEFESADETEREIELAIDVGAGYFVTPTFMIGAEIHQVNLIEHGELESSALYAGPSLAISGDGWWTSISVLPQLVTFKGSSPGSRLDLDHQERVRSRLILGLHL
jgi:hypothetical protein